MKKLSTIYLAATLSSLPLGITSASTVGETYGGVQYALGSYSEDGIDTIKPSVLVGRFGQFVNPSFSLEGRAGIGLQDDSVDIFGIEAAMDIDNMLGLYGVGHAPLNNSVSLYGLLGFTRAKATFSLPAYGVSASETESGMSYGFGANFNTGSNLSLNIEYTQYFNKSDFDFSAFSFGAVFKF